MKIKIMKGLIILLFTFFVAITSKAQMNDVFRKITGDSISCKITLVNENNLFYEFEKSNNRVESAMLSLDAIDYYIKDGVKVFSGGQSLSGYKCASGDMLRVGDTLLLGLPSSDLGFTYITQNSERVAHRLANTHVVIADFKIIHENIDSKTYVKVKGYGLIPILIDYEVALLVGEVINPKSKMTGQEAISMLKESKELLDLGVISSEEYQKIKKKLVLIINQ